MRKFIGLDIGGTKCAVLLAEVGGGLRIIDKMHFETQAERGFESVYLQLCACIDELVARKGIKVAQISGVGISCGGPLDTKRGLILSPPNLPGWDNVPLTQMLNERYGVPVFLQNDANACAVVEWKLGAGRGTENMIFLTMGTGMGAGVIAHGQLLIGATNTAGEVGHLRLTEDGPVGFGKAGSFEGYASGGGIGRQAQARTRAMLSEGKIPQWIQDGHHIETIDAHLMADYAALGNPDAIDLFQFVGQMLGRGLALLVDVFNPERIVIGSIFGHCEQLLRPAMEEALRREALPRALVGLKVMPALTGEMLGDYASIMVVLHEMGIDPQESRNVEEREVMRHYHRLFERYPMLEACKDDIMQAYLTLYQCFITGNKVLVAGNGGSAADSEHIVGEMMKGFYLKRPLPAEQYKAVDRAIGTILPGSAALLQQGLMAIALTGHVALTTAVINDLDPQLIFAQQVVSYARPGDVIIALSTSGNAKDVALAVRTASALGMSSIALTGRDGGILKSFSDVSIVIPCDVTAEIQELHLPVYHTLCAMLEAKFFDS